MNIDEDQLKAILVIIIIIISFLLLRSFFGFHSGQQYFNPKYWEDVKG